MKKLTHIGTVELISLPDDGIVSIPAKIDTGADGCSIWASNVHVRRGKLYFNFFAPGSAFYKDTPVVTTAFRVTSVKNSFGQEEFRYKIRLNIQLGDQVIKRWFSLADRSKNTYPVLLGKNLLKNRFIVDVAQKYIVSKPSHKNKILVLSTKPSGDFFDKVRKYNQMPVQYVPTSYKDLVFYMDGSDTKVVNAKDKNMDIANYTFTYFKSHASNSEAAVTVAEYLHFKGSSFVDKELMNYISGSKLSQYMRLSSYNLPIPKSIAANTGVMLKHYKAIVEELGTPFVLKDAHSDRGKNNFLIHKQADFKAVIADLPKESIMIAQKYIPNDGFLRIYVMDKEVELAVWRDSYPHKDKLKVHLNKPTGGTNAQLQRKNKVDGEIHDLAIRASNSLNRQIAGVDLIQDKESKKWYILEVNNAPQIKTGSFVDEKAEVLARFFDKEIRN